MTISASPMIFSGRATSEIRWITAVEAYRQRPLWSRISKRVLERPANGIWRRGWRDFLIVFTIAIDVVAHELSHGVTKRSRSHLFRTIRRVNESLSDVFGSLVKQYQRQQTADKADWIIGEGLLAKGIHGKGLRSMSQPWHRYDDPILGKDPQPAHMKDFVHTRQDNLAAFIINSGIPNHAFYLAASAIGGFAWKKRDMPGTTRCTINLWQKTPTSRPLPD